MKDQIQKTAKTLAEHLVPAHSGKDRKRQASVAENIEASLTELCVAVVAAAKDQGTTVTDIINDVAEGGGGDTQA